MIFSNPGGDIASIKAWGQDHTNTWFKGEIAFNPIFPSMYFDDVNHITVEVVNPTNAPITISNPRLSFTPNFGTYLLAESSLDLTSILGTNIPAMSTIPVIIDKAFHLSDFSLDVTTQLDDPLNSMTIQLSFVYLGTMCSSSISRSIIRPPAPTITFLGFTGPKEGENFIVKYADAPATVQARFQITNNARIPIATTTDIMNNPSETGMTLAGGVYRKTTTINGLSSDIISFSLKLSKKFFETVTDLLGRVAMFGISVVANSFNFIARLLGVIKAVKDIASLTSATSYISGVVNFIMGALQTLNLVWAIGTKKSEFTFPFPPSSLTTSTSWTSSFYQILTPYANDHYLYLDQERGTLTLTAYPSNSQNSEFDTGAILRGISAVLYIAAGCLLMFPGPWNIAVGSALGVAAAALAAGADFLWTKANDDAVPSANFTSVYVPAYQTTNISAIQPITEFNVALISLLDSSAELSGDLNAVNETISRLEGAINAGDYSAAALQNDALSNYTRMVSEDYYTIQNDMGVITTSIMQNDSEIMSSLQSAETLISTTGLSPADINSLQDAGLNQASIEDLNLSVIEMASTGELSTAIPNLFSNMTSIYNESIPVINKEISWFENTSNAALLNATSIRVNYLGMSVTTTDSSTLTILSALNNSMYSSYAVGNWKDACIRAEQLFSLARTTTTSTNNQSYLLTYGNDAQMIKQAAQRNLAIRLLHIPMITVTPGKSQDVTLVVLSEGAPSGRYVFETNSSWLGPNGTSIVVTQYNSNEVHLQVLIEEDPNISPGTYPVELRVSLPGTTTVIDSVLLVEVVIVHQVLTSVKPNSTSIFPGASAQYICSICNLGNYMDTYNVIFTPQNFMDSYVAYPTTVQESWVSINNSAITWDNIISGWEGTLTLDPGENVSIQLIISVPSDWIGWENATYEIIMLAALGTDSRVNGTTSFNMTVISTLQSMVNFVNWQLEDLIGYIHENVYPIIRTIISYTLRCAQQDLVEAYGLIANGSTCLGLFHDLVAQAMVKISEFETEFFNWLNLISDNDMEYITTTLHVIRDNIVILMGSSVGTNQGRDIASIEVNLLDLSDFVADEISRMDRACLNGLINIAALRLEAAIFEIALDIDTECTLTAAQHALDDAKTEVNNLSSSGTISQDLANSIIETIIGAQVNIEMAKNSI